MNILSCSGGGLPESECLFFKVIGMTNISNGLRLNLSFMHVCMCIATHDFLSHS